MATSAQRKADDILELRRLVELTISSFAQQTLQSGITALQAELHLDIGELQALREVSVVPQIQTLLNRQIAVIQPCLDGPEQNQGGTNTWPETATVGKAENGQATRDMPPSAAPSAAPSVVQGGPLTSASEVDPLLWPVVQRGAKQAEELAPYWQPSKLPLRAVPRCRVDSPLARRLLIERRPVIFTPPSSDSSPAGLVGSAVNKWDLDYLTANLGTVPCTVYRSVSSQFRYWDESKNACGYPFTEADRTEKLRLPIADFRDAVRRAAEARTRGEVGGYRYYLQTSLVEGVGPSLMADFRAFDWQWLFQEQRRAGWGELTSNLLLVGQVGNVTPAHYDEQQNIFAQLSGEKRVILFAPKDFTALYPFPVHHPNDRQSQVDLSCPDASRFPRFDDAQGFEVILQPGELLYIPQYWWHHIENLTDECVSINFWFRDQSTTKQVILPLSDTQHLAMRRNVEKFAISALGVTEMASLMPRLVDVDAPPQVRAARADLQKLLSHVMPEALITDWLRELIEGRYLPLGGGKEQLV